MKISLAGMTLRILSKFSALLTGSGAYYRELTSTPRLLRLTEADDPRKGIHPAELLTSRCAGLLCGVAVDQRTTSVVVLELCSRLLVLVHEKTKRGRLDFHSSLRGDVMSVPLS